MPKKTLSLSNELHLMIGAMRGVHRLTRCWIENFHGMDDPEVPEAVASMLVLVIERLRLIDRVVRGVVDPRLALCPDNDVDLSPGDPSEDDVRLETWSDSKLARHHRRQWKRAGGRLRAP